MISQEATYNFNIKNLKLKDKEVCENWQDLIFENDGSFQRQEQSMTFDIDGIEVVVFFELNVCGTITEDKGDYWTPGTTQIEIESVDVEINSVFIDEYEVEMDANLKKQFAKIVKNNL